MTECPGESDVTELANSTLAEFDQEIATLVPELCVPFSQAAMRLEGELLTIYSARCIPKGFRPKAPGCERRATRGELRPRDPNPNGVAPAAHRARPQPRWG
jgi:hypothetical protein